MKLLNWDEIDFEITTSAMKIGFKQQLITKLAVWIYILLSIYKNKVLTIKNHQWIVRFSIELENIYSFIKDWTMK